MIMDSMIPGIEEAKSTKEGETKVNPKNKSSTETKINNTFDEFMRSETEYAGTAFSFQ